MRGHQLIAALLFTVLTTSLLSWQAAPTQAGTLTLNNNSGTTSGSFFIDGEPTLVMNGFDLASLQVDDFVVMDRVSIAVQQAVPSQPIQVVIYEDNNGGSPQDATLLYQTEVFIQTAGTAFVDLPEPVTITAPVVWVGFYLPTGFRFFADESGSSVLTYWAWSPGTTFDLSNLTTAAVFGPADGSEPVNINQGGVARITAEVTPLTGSGFAGDGTNAEGIPIGIQIEGGEEDLSVLRQYPYCGERLIYDPEDVDVSAGRRFTTHCRADIGLFSPGEFINEEDLPLAVPSYERRGFFYEVFVNGQTAPGSSEELLVPVTHCLRPEQGELDTAVVGVAYGAPRAWEMLPTVRYNNEWICAELTHAGFVSYFVPRSGEETTLNADLYFSGFPYLQSDQFEEIDDYLCGYEYRPTFSVFNLGFETTPPSLVRVQLLNQRTGTILLTRDYTLPAMEGGETIDFFETGFTMPDIFVDEDTILRFIIDPENSVAEADETNNVFDRDGEILVLTNRCLLDDDDD